jgi:uncharacterized protein (UPF0276 family)
MTDPLPRRAGLGLKPDHYRAILAEVPDIGFFEIHAENYMGDGGPPHRYLAAIRERYPLSLHGVGLSLGGPNPLDPEHLARLKSLRQRYRPALFSEHLAWSTHDTGFLADLLPLPYTSATLAHVAGHISETQEALGCQMLLENPSSYLSFDESTWEETEFIAELVRRTGCGLLLDVNNVAISAANLGFDAQAYLRRYPLSHVQELHVAGHEEIAHESGEHLLIDSHGSPVAESVWVLLGIVLARTGPLPVLIERDNEVPPLPDLLAEAAIADGLIRAVARAAA